MTAIYTNLDTRNIDNEKYVQHIAPFRFASDLLKKWGLKFLCEIKAGFVQDFESVPIVKGSDKRAGTIHDYFSRFDSDPVVTKAQAAAIYFEFLEYCHDLDVERFKKTSYPWVPDFLVVPYVEFRDWTKRWIKWGVVYVAPGYFHKYSVMATCLEIAGLKGDPYMTVEKLEAAIVESEQATASIKAVPKSVDQKADLVAASEQVTTDLKEAKEEAQDIKSVS